MDDEILVRVVHGGAHIMEETQPLLDPEALAVAVGGDRHAIHVLHDEERQLSVGDAAVEQLRDVRVVQRREDLSFGDKAAIESSASGLPRSSLMATRLRY